MENLQKKCCEILEHYIALLNDYCPKRGAKFDNIPWNQGVFLDLIHMHRKFIKALFILLQTDDQELDIAIYTICRSLSNNALTIYYIKGFENVDTGELDNDLIVNELNAINAEYVRYLEITNKIQHKYQGKDLINYRATQPFAFTEDGKYKSWNDFHSKKDIKIINILKECDRGKSFFLSEQVKFNFAMKRFENYDWKNNIVNAFILNKVFTQYYHYTTVGGSLSRHYESKNIENIIHLILTSIDAVLKCLRPLKDILGEPQSINFIKTANELGVALYSNLKNNI